MIRNYVIKLKENKYIFAFTHMIQCKYKNTGYDVIEKTNELYGLGFYALIQQKTVDYVGPYS